MTAADKTRVRDAATVIALRDRDTDPAVLMGQRGARAAFMPDKFVFPGGAVDAADAVAPLVADVPEPCFSRLAEDTAEGLQRALGAAAVREFWEETGLVLGTAASWTDPPAEWRDFARTGHRPSAGALRFVFRALTPPGRPRRFDARFFLVDATAIQGDPDDFSRASDELRHLQWVPLRDARRFDLPFITEVVLAEVAGRLTSDAPPSSVPYFKNTAEASLFQRLYGHPQGPQD